MAGRGRSYIWSQPNRPMETPTENTVDAARDPNGGIHATAGVTPNHLQYPRTACGMRTDANWTTGIEVDRALFESDQIGDVCIGCAHFLDK